MHRYIIEFTKEGYVKYTSHLDMLRLFKRSFKKTEIATAYSNGFNPHPKMGFAQPLSLGYTSCCELLEFETEINYEPADIKQRLCRVMPEGVKILSCRRFKAEVKSLAAAAFEAIYEVVFPLQTDPAGHEKLAEDYMAQKEITVLKRQKKTKKMIEVDIRPKIRALNVLDRQNLTLRMRLDCGSASNLSPEQVISSFLEFSGFDIPRWEIEVERKEIHFNLNGNNLQ